MRSLVHLVLILILISPAAVFAGPSKRGKTKPPTRICVYKTAELFFLPGEQKKVDSALCQNYLKSIFNRANRAWFPLKAVNRNVVVMFYLGKKGRQVSQVTVTKSSGSDRNDLTAEKAVKNAAPYPLFPNGFPTNVMIRMNFDKKILFKRKPGEIPEIMRSPNFHSGRGKQVFPSG